MADDVYTISLSSNVTIDECLMVAPDFKREFNVVTDGVLPPGWILYECSGCLTRLRFNLFSDVERQETLEAHRCWTGIYNQDAWADDLGLTTPPEMNYAVSLSTPRRGGKSQSQHTWNLNSLKARGNQSGKNAIAAFNAAQHNIEEYGIKVKDPELPTYEKFSLNEVHDYETLTNLLPPRHEVSEPPIVEYFRKPPLDMHLVMTVKVNTVAFTAKYTLTMEEVFPRQGEGDVRDNMAAAMECLLKDIAYSVRRSFDGR